MWGQGGVSLRFAERSFPLLCGQQGIVYEQKYTAEDEELLSYLYTPIATTRAAIIVNLAVTRVQVLPPYLPREARHASSLPSLSILAACCASVRSVYLWVLSRGRRMRRRYVVRSCYSLRVGR